MLKVFCMAKLSTACGFTKGVGVDVWYLYINYILEDNPPYVQSDTSELDSGNNSLATIRIRPTIHLTSKNLAVICGSVSQSQKQG